MQYYYMELERKCLHQIKQKKKKRKLNNIITFYSSSILLEIFKSCCENEKNEANANQSFDVHFTLLYMGCLPEFIK